MTFCMKRGYGGCKCQYCLPWVRRWEREEKGWDLVDSMIKDGRSLYSMCDRLQAECPDMLHNYRKIEDKFIARSIEKVSLLSEEGEINE